MILPFLRAVDVQLRPVNIDIIHVGVMHVKPGVLEIKIGDDIHCYINLLWIEVPNNYVFKGGCMELGHEKIIIICRGYL